MLNYECCISHSQHVIYLYSFLLSLRFRIFMLIWNHLNNKAYGHSPISKLGNDDINCWQFMSTPITAQNNHSPWYIDEFGAVLPLITILFAIYFLE